MAPVPAELVMDHLCRNTSCINPSHLEPVTPSVNVRRGACQALRPWPTHCKHGHSMAEGNYFIRKTPGGFGRQCKVCHKRHQDESAARRRARDGM